jgi:Thioredoxin-like
MLKYITFSIIVLFSQTLNAQQTKTVPHASGGIKFAKISLAKTFEIAKEQNKPVFVEIYAIGCHHCENFKKFVDNNAGVGKYYNDKFISYQLEVNSPEGQAFRKKHNIYVLSTPLMSFWSPDETLMHIQTSGDEQNNEPTLKAMADRAIDPAKNSASWKNYFQQGVNDDNFLIEFGYMSRMICDTVSNMAAMKTFADKQASTGIQNPINFLVLQKVVIDDENGIFKHIVNNLDAFYAKYPKKDITSTIENIVMYSLYCSRANDYSLEKIAEMKNNLRKIGIDEKSVAGRFLLLETRAFFKANQPEKAVELIDIFYKGLKSIDKKDGEFIDKYVHGFTQDEVVLSRIHWIYKK